MHHIIQTNNNTNTITLHIARTSDSRERSAPRGGVRHSAARGPAAAASRSNPCDRHSDSIDDSICVISVLQLKTVVMLLL